MFCGQSSLPCPLCLSRFHLSTLDLISLLHLFSLTLSAISCILFHPFPHPTIHGLQLSFHMIRGQVSILASFYFILGFLSLPYFCIILTFPSPPLTVPSLPHRQLSLLHFIYPLLNSLFILSITSPSHLFLSTSFPPFTSPTCMSPLLVLSQQHG